jgi:hypothetical protein
MTPHVHISGINAWLTFLFIVVAFGSLRLLAMSHPNNTLAQAWLALI